MIKSIQTKIILIFFVLAIIIIAALSFFQINVLERLIMEPNIANDQAFSNMLTKQILETKLITAIAIGVFVIITLLVGYFVSKSIIKPINTLIKNAEKIAKGEDVEIEENEKGKKEVGELVNAFSLMTTELKQNLNQLAKQKKQIETILLHMTDGIIAFDMEGNIIHINPAAISLLNLNTRRQYIL